MEKNKFKKKNKNKNIYIYNKIRYIIKKKIFIF